jgi:hypothetical protein
MISVLPFQTPLRGRDTPMHRHGFMQTLHLVAGLQFVNTALNIRRR